jgi:hypothetical protein
MSLKFEQYRSLFRTREFLRRLLTRPMLKPKDVREQAYRCLRHYPFLDSKGAPMFSSDDFVCPVITKEGE